MKQLSRSIPLGVRFGMNIDRSDDGCWIWKGAKAGNGYGSIFKDGRPEMAHRVSWILHFGSIPEGMYVLHSCDVPACVNPAHLFIGSQSENLKDAVAKGRVVPPCYQPIKEEVR